LFSERPQSKKKVQVVSCRPDFADAAMQLIESVPRGYGCVDNLFEFPSDVPDRPCREIPET
jgi:hypothetical protein